MEVIVEIPKGSFQIRCEIAARLVQTLNRDDVDGKKLDRLWEKVTKE